MSELMKGQKPAPAPTPTAPPTMPDPLSPQALDDRRRAQTAATMGGRSSTTLTTAPMKAGATLAGGYGGQKLGG